MHKEILAGKKALTLRPKDLKEGDIFIPYGGVALTQLGCRLQGLFIEQEELGRVLQDGKISDHRCIEVYKKIEDRRTELENMTGRKIPNDTNVFNALRTRFGQIVADRRKARSNLNIVGKGRELVKT